MPLSPDDLPGLFVELIEGSDALPELDIAQAEAWVSGLLSSWRWTEGVEDVEAADRSFLSYCEANPSAVTQRVADMISLLLPVLAAETETASLLIASQLDEDAAADGFARGHDLTTAVGAWSLTEDRTGGQTILVEFGYAEEGDAEEGENHSILVEVTDEQQIADLHVGPAAASLLAPLDEDDAREVESEEIGIETALAKISAAWSVGLVHAADVPESLELNELFVRARLRRIGSGELPPFAVARLTSPGAADDEVDEDRRRADAAGVETLCTALRRFRAEPDPGGGAEMVAAIAAVVSARVADLTATEQTDLGFLEWADWIGAAIGLVRAGPDSAVEPALLVDYINRCNEVSSAIPKEHRPFVEHAFRVAIDALESAGAIAEGRLTAAGWWALPRGATQAWSGTF